MPRTFFRCAYRCYLAASGLRQRPVLRRATVLPGTGRGQRKQRNGLFPAATEYSRGWGG